MRGFTFLQKPLKLLLYHNDLGTHLEIGILIIIMTCVQLANMCKII
jgi:hypothetical protein